MGWIRLVGALLLALSGFAGARWMNRGATETLGQVEGWLGLLRYARTQVDCFALPVSVILSRADASLLRRCGYGGAAAPESFEALLRQCAIRDGETARLLQGFAEEFGRSYREEQSRGCDYYVSLLDERREALLAQLPARKRINSALCISGALAILILLI